MRTCRTGYFGSISHTHLRAFLDLRIKDGVVRRMIDKWLKAGVLEDGVLRRSETGTPQGGVVSPMLSNVFLHHVLDEWFEREAKPRLRGSCQLVRFADDFVMAFEDARSGRRMLDVLGKRLGRYGLTLHETKTRCVDFRPKRPRAHDPGHDVRLPRLHPRVGTVAERQERRSPDAPRDGLPTVFVGTLTCSHIGPLFIVRS